LRIVDLAALKRILVATDFSDPSEEALKTAIAFGRMFGATLDLVHVAVEVAYPLPPPIDLASLPIDIGPALERAADEVLAHPLAVDVGGVEERDPRLESGVDHGERLLVVAAHAEVVRAEADDRHLRPALS
jgi:nucleotide-binding universal stress UspA family protein